MSNQQNQIIEEGYKELLNELDMLSGQAPKSFPIDNKKTKENKAYGSFRDFLDNPTEEKERTLVDDYYIAHNE